MRALPLVLVPLLLGGLVAVSCRSTLSHSGTDARGAGPVSTNDPHTWLEEVTGEKALAWVREQNARSTAELTASPTFEPLRNRLLSIYDSKERIPMPMQRGAHLYNFWRDDRHVRGILRRTTLEEYRKASPAWETVLDLDAVAAAEHENWVWQGIESLPPDHRRSLVSLSRGGADAAVIREFDLVERRFVPGGFEIPEAKSTFAWRDADTLYVGSDFGPGSLTQPGYPRVIREWRRGTPLASAPVVFEGRTTDSWVGVAVIRDRGHTYEFIQRAMTFFSNETFLRRGDRWVKLDKPDDAQVSTFGGNLLLTLRSDWAVGGRTHRAGALLAIECEAFLRGERVFSTLFEPAPRKSLASFDGTRHHLIVNELENVRNRLYVLTPGPGGWSRRPLEVPGFGTLSASGVDAEVSDDYWLEQTDFLTPSSLSLGRIGGGAPERLKSLPAFFNAEGLRIEQFEAQSRDGTRVPYFQVSRTTMKHDGRNPTLLEGYGGFEVSYLSSYDAAVGAAWLEAGRVYVLANIRGGGEFGPSWHQAALKAHRQRAYDDFIAVAEDLVRRRVTSPRHLGITGGSNGGLLVGNMLVQRPDLFGAIDCWVPLLDMRRYHQLLAGASWMGEYGNPDVPEEWEFLQRYSPYHQVRADRRYPRPLILTSTRDDRVHPGHARKMVARMIEQGHPVLYYENTEGGHGAAANNAQRAFMGALSYSYLESQLAGGR